MSLCFIGKSTLVLSLLAAATFSYAKSGDQIPCPSISTIQQASSKLNDVVKLFNGNYVVDTSAPAFKENENNWYLMTGIIAANTPEEALTTAKDVVQKISAQIDKNARDLDHHVFYCRYGHGDVVAVTGDIFSTSSFKTLFNKR